MKLFTIIALFAISVMMIFGCAGKKVLHRPELDGIRNWVCVYSEDANAEQIAKFDLAVLDADSHPPLSSLKEETMLLGYLSLGEVSDYRWYWPEVENASWLLERNPNWNSRFVDVRSPAWRRIVLNKIIPAILAQGFDGLFLDTVDTAEYLERYRSEGTLPGAEAAMVKLIRAIRKKYPSIYLIVNRGFAILEQVGDAIDGVVAESVFSIFNFETKTARLRTQAELQTQLDQLRTLRRTFDVEVLTLDYLAHAANSEIAAVTQRARQEGFIPYISTVQLDTVFTFTLSPEL